MLTKCDHAVLRELQFPSKFSFNVYAQSVIDERRLGIECFFAALLRAIKDGEVSVIPEVASFLDVSPHMLK